MAVSHRPVSLPRAVWALGVVHLRMALNASLRDTGLAMTALGAIALALVASLLVLPFWVGGVALGVLLSPALTGGPGLAPLAVVYTALPVGAAVLSMLVGDARSLDWEKLEVFPVPRLALFTAELLACCTNPLLAAGLGGLTLLTATLAVRVPGAAPALAVVGFTAVALLLSLRQLLSLLAGWLLRNLQTGLVLGLLVAPTGLLALGLRPGSEPRAELAEQGGLLAWLPAGWQLTQAAGRPGGWSGGLLGPLLFPGAALWAAWRLAFRPTRGRSGGRRRPERLWTFPTATLGVARLHLASVLASELGRLSLVGPLVWVVLVLSLRGQLGSGLDGRWVALSAWLMLPGLMANLLSNQFGTDRGAVKALFLLPLGEGTILRGKALALSALMLGQGALLSLAVVAVAQVAPLALLAAVCSGLSAFTVQLTIGQWTSLTWPRPVPRKGLRQPPGGLLGGLVSLGASLGSVAPLGGLWWWLRDDPGLLLLGTGLALGLALGFFLVFSGQAAGLMRLRRERLVETLSC